MKPSCNVVSENNIPRHSRRKNLHFNIPRTHCVEEGITAEVPSNETHSEVAHRDHEEVEARDQRDDAHFSGPEAEDERERNMFPGEVFFRPEMNSQVMQHRQVFQK